VVHVDEGRARDVPPHGPEVAVRLGERHVVRHGRAVDAEPAWQPNLQPDFNVRVCDSFDASSSAVLRELDESNRFVQKSAESTSM
jgi:hypothetical protein